MSDTVPSDQVKQADALQKASQAIEPVTSRFPISRIVAPLADTFDWLLDDVSVKEDWEREQQSFQRKFAEHWRLISGRASDPEARQISGRALKDADYDPLGGSQPWGVELTRAFRAALAELGPVANEAVRVLPSAQRMRACARAMNTQGAEFVLPVISYRSLLESEWRAILDRLDELVELTLAFEGAVVVWLIGGFYRDVNGRLKLHPQLSLAPPQSGTRVKPIHLLLGTAYEEQCPSLIPLVRAARGTRSRLSDSLFAQTLWHRVVVQLDTGVDDYHLFSWSRLNEDERAIAETVMYLDQQPREKQVLVGTVHKAPRPWGHLESVSKASPLRSPASGTRLLPPLPALQAASESLETRAPAQLPTAASLHQDAEDLRRKGMALAVTDPAIAQKYLLASTVLENTSVDVWLKLVDLGTSARQKEAFRREAEKALKRQRRSK